MLCACASVPRLFFILLYSPPAIIFVDIKLIQFSLQSVTRGPGVYMRLGRAFFHREIIVSPKTAPAYEHDHPSRAAGHLNFMWTRPCARYAGAAAHSNRCCNPYAVGMKYDFAMENCLGTDYPNLHELNKNCYGFSPASVQNGPQAAAAAAAADEQTMYKVTITRWWIISYDIILWTIRRSDINPPATVCG